jgi:threonine aldolase
LTPPEVETNLVWLQVDSDLGTAKEVAAALQKRNILVHAAGPQTIRMVTHLDVSAADCEYVADTIRKVVPRLVPARAG